jgi:hypothetical protein
MIGVAYRSRSWRGAVFQSHITPHESTADWPTSPTWLRRRKDDQKEFINLTF